MNVILKNTQLALPLFFKTENNIDNFIVSDFNVDALNLINKWNITNKNKYKDNNVINARLIFGPQGSGKSHLSSIFQNKTNALILKKITTKDLRGIKKGNNFIIDNLDVNNSISPEMLMHLLNEVTYNSSSLLLFSRCSPFEMDWGLPDLNSRLRSILSAEIKMPSDEILLLLLVKYASDKKMFISDYLSVYIIERIERSYASVINIIDELDLKSREAKKKITLKQVQETLDLI